MTHRAWFGRLFLDQFAHAAVLHALWLALEHPSATTLPATASALTGAALNGFRNASLNGKPFAVAPAPADGGKAPPSSVGARPAPATVPAPVPPPPGPALSYAVHEQECEGVGLCTRRLMGSPHGSRLFAELPTRGCFEFDFVSRTRPPATDVPMPAATFAKWLDEALPFAPPRAATASATAGRKVSAEWLHARYATPADLAAALKRAFIHARVESLQVLGTAWLQFGGYERTPTVVQRTLDE